MTFKTTVILILAAATIGWLPGTLSAHEAEKGPNGGQLVDIKGHHVEMVASPADLIFILTGDKDAPISPAGAKAKAIVQDGGKTTQLNLEPVEPNKLVGKLTAALGPGSKVVFTGTLGDGHALQGRFVTP